MPAHALNNETTTAIICTTSVALLLFVVGLASWRFYRWIAIRSDLTASEKITCWDVYIKAVSALTIIVAGSLAFLRYVDQRERELQQQETDLAQKTREFNVKIYGEAIKMSAAKTVLLNEVSDLAATIACTKSLDSPAATIAGDRFERLYFGELVIYELDDVSNKMIDLRDAWAKWKRTGLRPTELLGSERTNGTADSAPWTLPTKPNKDFMQSLALELADACQAELQSLDQYDPSTPPQPER